MSEWFNFALDVFRCVRRRDSQSACLMMIGLGEWLSVQDMKDMADYFQALHECEVDRATRKSSVA